MTRTHRSILAGLAIALLCTSAASATETITYTYDARGRLIKVKHEPTSSVNANNQACYQYDKADNRTNVTTTVGGTPPACP